MVQFSFVIQVLIETYWNVKFDEISRSSLVVRVLIETYWNVKLDVRIDDPQYHIVLIETYWNVKLHQVGNGSVAIGCINRNILECKGR